MLGFIGASLSLLFFFFFANCVFVHILVSFSSFLRMAFGHLSALASLCIRFLYWVRIFPYMNTPQHRRVLRGSLVRSKGWFGSVSLGVMVLR